MPPTAKIAANTASASASFDFVVSEFVATTLPCSSSCCRNRIVPESRRSFVAVEFRGRTDMARAGLSPASDHDRTAPWLRSVVRAIGVLGDLKIAVPLPACPPLESRVLMQQAAARRSTSPHGIWDGFRTDRVMQYDARGECSSRLTAGLHSRSLATRMVD